MNELKQVAQRVAEDAMQLIHNLVADTTLPGISDPTAAREAIKAVVTQDPGLESKRIWAAVFAVLTAILAVPEVQALLGAWTPVATAVLSAVLASWSKVFDPRPIR